MTPKLVLAVVDGLKPAMLERAVSTGRAPAMKAVIEHGTYVEDCCAAFLIAGLSVLIPPVSVLALGFFIWLRLGGRRREGEKHAGLRILR